CTGPTKSALTKPPSPAPEGPGSPPRVGNPANTVMGNPVRQLTMGNRLQPCTSALGPRLKGKSHAPLNVNVLRTSKSDDARKSGASNAGTWLLKFRKPEASSMLWAQV